MICRPDRVVNASMSEHSHRAPPTDDQSERQSKPVEPKAYTPLVDTEGKAKELKLLSPWIAPHTTAFWTNATAFFVSCLATFAAAR